MFAKLTYCVMMEPVITARNGVLLILIMKIELVSRAMPHVLHVTAQSLKTA